MVDVFLNQKFIGKVDDANTFIKKIKEERREGKILDILNVGFKEDYDTIEIETSKGRLRRPLIVVENGKSKLTKELIDRFLKDEILWDDLVKEGVIEYLDSLEEEDAYVGLDQEDLSGDHTHLEISPVTILGLTTAILPYSNFGSSSRLIRGSKIQKQSLGMYASNYLVRVDTDASISHYPQRPIVTSFMTEAMNYDQHPSGHNVTIAIMSYQGYNMEDSIIVNKSSVDRGFARSTFFTPYVAEELRYSGGLVDEIGIPDKEVKGYKSEEDYKLLEKDGVVYTGAVVDSQEVIIGKSSPPRFLGELEEFSIAANIRKESSVTIKHGSEGVIDITLISENEEGNRIVQTKVREQRIPEIGDKFASRHGQKGVIGMQIPQEDMPFSTSGVIPDIIFSPHSIPSRMTISHLLEALAGKVGSLRGEIVDGTAFDAEKEEDLRKQLNGMGFRDNGTEIFYNGITGEKFEAKIFVGNMYYLKLKHMVANKLHSRAAGRIQLLTRQPIEGRAKGGGLRVGEMEKDCFVAHGAALLLKERFDSDKTIIPIAEKSGMVAVNDLYKKTTYDPITEDNTEISNIEVSYAFKLLLDELKSLGIYTKLVLESKYKNE
jgi:DNA-directed RNA polymerase subunit B'